MSQFLRPCYVRIEDANKRKEICKKTTNFLLPINMFEGIDSNYLFAFDGWISRLYGCGIKGEQGRKELEISNFIDCGSDIELFLRLIGVCDDNES